jgi:NADPH:quinone reductase-like Zn-dependent oxidoreductase
MRQVEISRHGGPDVLVTRERPDPSPQAGEVRIRVRAAGVNFADILARLGLYPDAPRPPFVPGYEVAGIVDTPGAGVTWFAPGDRVVALTRFGGYAESVCVPAAIVFRAPEDLSDAEAAAIPVNYLTAHLALYRLANLGPGETVLVHNAGGGVGIAAIQLARLRRATIVGTASAAKHEALRTLGVNHAIDYRHRSVTEEVTRLTGGRGVDVILDPLGGRSFADSYRMLAPLGRLVMYGISSAAPGGRRRWWDVMRTLVQMPSFKPLSLINRNRGVLGVNLANLWSEAARLGPVMDQLLAEFRAGRLRPVVARTFPLDRAGDAHQFIQERANIGKVILTT